MIIDKGTINVAPGVEYITEWRDNNGQFIIDQYVLGGRVIMNKTVTGCGFTTYCLYNNHNTIIISPRLII